MTSLPWQPGLQDRQYCALILVTSKWSDDNLWFSQPLSFALGMTGYLALLQVSPCFLSLLSCVFTLPTNILFYCVEFAGFSFWDLYLIVSNQYSNNY